MAPAAYARKFIVGDEFDRWTQLVALTIWRYNHILIPD